MELRKIAQPKKIILTEKIKTKLFILQTHVGQANRKPKAKQMHSKLKLQAVGLRHISKFSENFYFLLKGWACPSSISHPSSRISRLKKLKSCHTPITIHNQRPTNTI